MQSRALVAASLCALLLGALSVAPAGAGEASAHPDRGDVDAAVAFRSKLGLPAGRSFVESTFGNPAYSNARWGVPLDRAEVAAVDRRADAQKALGKAFRAWDRDVQAAGAYIDQHDGGAAVFLTTADPAAARRGIADVLPKSAAAGPVRFERVRYSMRQLLVAQARVDADVRAGLLAAVAVQSTAIDARSNAVVVGVADATDAVRVELASRYGDAVIARTEGAAQGGDADDQCVSRKDCPPAKGGTEIVSDYNDAYCTTGFLVRVVGSPEPRILTAGHCIGRTGGTGTSRTWTQAGVEVGWSELTTWSDGSDADAGIITPAAGAVGGDRNLLFRASTTDIIPITAWQRTAEQVQGGLVCRAGVTSGYHCGTIALTNRTKDVDGRTIDHQWVVDFDACPGDSGGPYLLDGSAFGVHTDSTYGCDPSTNQAWYSPIGWILDVLAQRGHPIELCTTAACGRETRTWTRRGSLESAVWDPHLVPLSRGRVLALGGYSSDTFGPLAGGADTPAPQIFDPATQWWAEAAAVPWTPAVCVGQFAVRLADGRVLVGGGRQLSGPSDACDAAYLFDGDDGARGSWAPAAAPPVALESAGAALLADGRAFVTGGSGADGSTPVAFAYAPATDEWSTLAAPPAGALGQLVLRLADGRVLASGGWTSDGATGGYLDSPATSIYDPETDSWSETTAVGAAGMAGVALKNGKVVVAGGRHLTWDGGQQSSFLSTVRLFDPATATWSTLAPLPSGRADFALVQLGNSQLLAAGGRVAGTDGSELPSRVAYIYDWTTRAWHPAPSLNDARAGVGGIVIGGGAALVVGGRVSTESYVPGDVLPPTAGAPSTALRSGARTGTSAVPIRLTWSATDVGGSGVGTFDIARSTDGGAFTTIATRVPATTWDGSVSRNHVYRFEVRPRDWAGNLGAWKAGPSVRIKVTQDSSSAVKYSSSWTRATSSSYDGGSVRYSKSAGASATYAFSGRAISFVASKGPARGSAKVYIDGSYVTTVNLYSSTLSHHNVVYQRTWSSQGSHTIKIVVVGTSGHPRVDVDAFVVISNP